MTPEELGEVPLDSGFSYADRMVNGETVRVVVSSPSYVLRDASVVRDSGGNRWVVGTHDGRILKRRINGRS